MDINEIINLKLKDFEENLLGKTESEKNLVHYNTAINISRRILLYKDEKANFLKEKLINYFETLEESDYLIKDKLSSSILHEYLLPIVQYLIHKERFITNGDLHLFVIMGIILDIALYYFLNQFYFPIFIFTFFLLGIYRRKQAKVNGKYAAMFW